MIISFSLALDPKRLCYFINAHCSAYLSADAQHRRSALLSVLIYPSHQSTTTHVQVMRPRRLPTTFTLPLCSPPYHSATNLCLSLRLYLAHTSDHHSHRSLHNRPPFSIEYLSLYPSYPLLVSLPSYLVPLFNISPPLRRYLATQLPYL